jgi:hypothetical protein
MRKCFKDNEFQELYAQGLQDAELARRLNCTQSAIFYYRKRMNIPKNNKITTQTISKGYKNEVEITDFQKSFLLGLMLGDGHLRDYKRSKTAWGSFSHSMKQEVYVNYKIDNLKNLVTKCSYKEMHDKRTNKIYKSLNVYLKSCKPLYEIYNSIYKDKLKGFYDKDYIYNNFTDISLAILIGDDGYKTSHGISIATNSFKYEDIMFLQKIIYDKFNIKSTIHKGNRLYMLAESKEIIHNICKKYLPQELLYKCSL